MEGVRGSLANVVRAGEKGLAGGVIVFAFLRIAVVLLLFVGALECFAFGTAQFGFLLLFLKLVVVVIIIFVVRQQQLRTHLGLKESYC